MTTIATLERPPFTAAASHATETAGRWGSVVSIRRLCAMGVDADRIAAHVAAGRWRRLGRVVVTHTGLLTVAERHAVCLGNAGPRSVLTSFTVLECLGLTGWHRDEVHVLVPAGADVRRVRALPVVVHRVVVWAQVPRHPERRWHDPADAALVAAASLSRPRSAVGVLAAVVQQRLAPAAAMRELAVARHNLRHRAVLVAALGDIGMGAEALSEIDFAQLCRRARLAEPERQSVRRGPDGGKRYLDAEWVRRDGRRVVAEVDGGLHLRADQWWADQERQNEITLGDTIVLRYPSAVIRTDPSVVIDQLRRAGVPPASSSRHQ